LPLDHLRSLRASEASGPEIELLGSAVAEFRPAHPYLLFSKRSVASIRKRANNNPQLLLRLKKSLQEQNSASGGQEARAGMKRRSRRLIHTSFLALISDGPTKENALRVTRSALSQFTAETSWKTRPVIQSFLDCAEIAVAVSLAYDWLYGELSLGERQAIEESIRRHVLEPALAAYEDRFVQWPKRRDNCTLVSNSGILVASLTVLERYPAISVELIRKSLASTWPILNTLAPDGAWPEGLSYWSLAMRYAGLMIAALESTLGQSFGLADRPGLAQTGDFALHAVGPFGSAFNFGDSEPRFDVSSLAWFAHRFRRPIDARLIDKYDGWYLPFLAIWKDRPKIKPTTAKPPTGKVFYSGSVACFRNTWSTGARAGPVFLAIKGGNTPVASGQSSRPEHLILHAQADAGSFILDGAKHRWIIDLGSDDYDLPGYFDHGVDSGSGPRWRYYRTQAAGHNTLVVDGRNQIPNARAPIIGDRVTGDCKWAVFDLSAAYGKPAGSIRRGAALIGRQALIQDEVGPEISGTIVWAIHTIAQPVSVAGSVARFRLGNDRFVARILEPGTACFELGFPPEPRSFPIADVRQLHSCRNLSAENTGISELPRRADDGDRRASGPLIRRLQIVWPKATRRLSVLLLPDCGDNDNELALPVTPLEEWLARRPVRLARCPRREYSVTSARDAGLDFPIGRPRLPAGLRNHSPEVALSLSS
jgi:hypothetical protein